MVFEKSLASSSPASRRLSGPMSKLHFADVEDAARDFNILKIVQATFYATVVNKAMELSVVSRDMAGDLKSTLKGLWWITFKS